MTESELRDARAALMRGVSIDGMIADLKGKAYGQLVLHHLREHRSHLPEAIDASLALASADERIASEAIIDEYNLRGYDPKFWASDAGDILSSVSCDLNDALFPAPVEEAGAFNLFQLITLNFALMAHEQKALRDYIAAADKCPDPNVTSVASPVDSPAKVQMQCRAPRSKNSGSLGENLALNSNVFWVLRIYELTTDSMGAAPGSKWIFSPQNSGGSEYIVYDEGTDTAVAKYTSLVEALNVVTSSMTGRGGIALSRAVLSDAGIRWGEQNVLASLDDWRRGSSFVTAAGIGQTKEQFIEYLRAVLISRPPLLRRGAVLFLMSMIPVVIVLLLIILVFRACS